MRDIKGKMLVIIQCRPCSQAVQSWIHTLFETTIHSRCQPRGMVTVDCTVILLQERACMQGIWTRALESILIMTKV
jgi:hypothetical protein